MTVSPYSVIAANPVAGGTGYSVNDVLTLQDGSAGIHATAAQVTVAGVSSGVVTAVVPAVLGNYSVQPTSPVSVTGGGGSGCTLNPTWGTLYALPFDLQQRYDCREFGDLLVDGSEQADPLDQVTIGTNANRLLLQFLSDAGGDVEAALLAAGRYANTDLYSLTGNSLSLLKRIVCEIAIAYIFERKPMYRTEQLKAYRESKEQTLKMLASGKNVFNLPLVITAGAPEATGPTHSEYRSYNLLCDRARGYPARQLPFNR
jgi:hypothetical protein